MSHGCKTGRIISKNINYLEATGLRKLMMNCYLLDVHIDCCFIYENGCLELGKVGPLNMLCPRLLSRLHIILQGISSQEDISKNWWTEFSSWQDLRALLRTGTTLSIHRVVSYLRKRFEEISAYEATIEMIDENGNIEIVMVEDNGKILQSFTVKAKRKRLRRLKDIAAYNVAKHISSEYDLDYLDIPTTLKPLVKTFIVTYSGNYIIEFGQYLE